jgi:hypothetical protein
MENVYALLPPGYYKGAPQQVPVGWEAEHLGALDQYCLALIVLFHDVGNIFGRAGHQKRIQEVYDFVWGDQVKRHSQEKEIVEKAAGAHCGEASDGSKDTLKELETEFYFKKGKVRLREIAALLRFADELAEGPQRTSEFMRRMHLYPPDSEPYHDYAASKHVTIDRANGRVALRYDFHMEKHGPVSSVLDRLKDALQFTYKRITKLDQERKYARFYSPLLAPFAVTYAQFRFWVNNKASDLNLTPIQIDDKVVPGEAPDNIIRLDAAYEPDWIIKQLEPLLRPDKP